MSKASTPFYPAPSTWQTSGPNLWSDVSRLPTVGTEFSACHRCGHKDAKPQGKEVPAPALAGALGAGGCASGMGAGWGSVRGATTADARHLSHPLPSLCLTSSPSVVALAPASAGKLLWVRGRGATEGGAHNKTPRTPGETIPKLPSSAPPTWAHLLSKLLPADLQPFAATTPSSMISDPFVLLLKGATPVGGSGGQGEGQAWDISQPPDPLHRLPSITSYQSVIQAPASLHDPSVWVTKSCPFAGRGRGGCNRASGHMGWEQSAHWS